jgi:hypothetical protein
MNNKNHDLPNGSEDNTGKNNKLTIECKLLDGNLPIMEITYCNRKISAFCSLSLMMNPKALLKEAIEILEYRNTISSFKQ